MAITFVAAGTLAQDSGSGGNVTPALPAGIAANDILVLVISAADNVVCTVPAAYTKKLETNSGTIGRQTIAWARATGSDSAPLVTHTAGNAIGARILAYRGCATSGDPFSTSSANAAAQGTGVTLTATTITPAVNEMVLFVASVFDSVTSNISANAFSGWSGTNPTFTERTDDPSNGLNTQAWEAGTADGLGNGSATGSRTVTLVAGMSAAGTSVATLVSLIVATAAGGVGVLPQSLRPTVVGPSARAFHMLQHIPTVPVVAAAAPVPFALLDWPNTWAKPNPVETRTIAGASEFWMLQDTFFAAAGQAPANLDWPVPKGKPYPLSTWLISVNQLAGKDTFFGAAGQPPANLDWPNPTRAEVPSIDLRSWLQSLKQNLLGQDTFFSAPGVGPDYDWPNPLAAERNPQDHIKSTELKLIGQDQFFSDAGRGPVYDWPNPQSPRAASDLRTHIWNPLLTLLNVIVQAPFAFFDWIVPLGKTPNPSLKTHIDPLKTNLQGQDQFFGPAGLGPLYDWPNPQTPKQPIVNRVWHLPNWITTLGSIIPAVVTGAEIILLLPMGKLAKRITSKIYEVLD